MAGSCDFVFVVDGHPLIELDVVAGVPPQALECRLAFSNIDVLQWT